MTDQEKKIMDKMMQDAENIEIPESLNPENMEKLLWKKKRTSKKKIYGALAASMALVIGLGVFSLPNLKEEPLEISSKLEVAESYDEIYECIKSYQKNQEKSLDIGFSTEEAFIKVGNKKFLRTGDIGYIDKEGVVHFRSRLKRMIISNGYNIYPANIESVTQKCQLVASCAAVGREDKLRGEKVVVFIVAKESASERQIKKELSSIYKKNLAKYEIPREIRFIDALPQTKLAKVDFKALEKL